MILNELYKTLDYVDHTREKRTHYAQLIIDKPEFIQPLLEIIFMVDDTKSNRAAWLLEFVTKNDLTLLHPHLNYFISNIDKVYQDSSVRPIAKICENLSLSFYKNQHTLTRKYLIKEYRRKMVETGFNWMITNQKVATKAYAMTMLYHLGTEFKWIHPELQLVIKKDYISGSAAFKARSRHINKWISKYKNRETP